MLCVASAGQERKEVEGAQHLACTIEMVNMGKRCDVAVIDEIQMIGDESRGWAWTRALQGVPANEIHLCGDASALPLVRDVGRRGVAA
jgi:ATP-dependent RNA helicase SUPV3L1/SUV3